MTLSREEPEIEWRSGDVRNTNQCTAPAFHEECGSDTYKNALIKNLVILFVFFCAFEPKDSFFKPICFLVLISLEVGYSITMYGYGSMATSQFLHLR